MKLFNHGPHIVIDLITCGLWIPVHLILWACAPTVPVGGASSSAAAAAGSASTTIVFGGPGPLPQGTSGQQPAYQSYPAAQPVAGSPSAYPPAWAIEEARERLPADAPWEAVASMAWEYTQRKDRELPS